MTNKPYTPDTDEVLQGFIASTFSAGISASEAHERADRWLATIEAAAEQRGAVKALREAADIKLGNGYYEMLVEDELNARADDREIELPEGDDD